MSGGTIANNRKAFFDYFIEEHYEAGMILEGWEVKAIRAGRCQLQDAYVKLINGTPHLVGSNITPLVQASSHVRVDQIRIRKLLLRAEELKKIVGKIEQRGYTMVPLNLHFKRGYIKLEIGLAKGKKQHDKRQTIKDRDLDRDVRASI